LVSTKTLYGRYWGCHEEHNNLHFETCYYQGIEYCIKNKLALFNSGAQGGHKISRGFEPVVTSSAHWIKDPRFATAIEEFTQTEKQHVAL
jgi:predicted N-acyltransferase